jgi:hypothetical protein
MRLGYGRIYKERCLNRKNCSNSFEIACIQFYTISDLEGLMAKGVYGD